AHSLEPCPPEFRTDDEPSAHFPGQTRARTSVQEEPSAAFFSGSPSRRSSSAFCSSVSATAPGLSAMLSQMASTIRIRSATGSWKTSSRDGFHACNLAIAHCDGYCKSDSIARFAIESFPKHGTIAVVLFEEVSCLTAY